MIKSKHAIFLLLSVLFVISASHEINLTCSDLGRHLANGQFVFKNPKLLTSNFYSYTEPDHEFINHHWGAGVIFEALRQVSGFDGLSISWLLFMLMSFLLVFHIAIKQSTLLISMLMAILLIPIMTFRREIRPEVFSYLFCSLLFWMLWHVRERKIPFHWVYVLPLLMLLWVNIHIYFTFGLVLAFIFFCEIGIKTPDHRTSLLLVFVACCTATLINPIGIRLPLYPLRIFEDYGYKIIENQTLLFLIQRGLHLPVYTIFFVAAALWMFLIVVALLRSPKSIVRSEHIATLMFLGLSVLAQRNLPYFGFFAIVSLSLSAQSLLTGLRMKGVYAILPYLAVGVSLLYYLTDSFAHYNFAFKTGLAKTGQDSAAFFKTNELQGPIFNNYDIGSYLIFGLFPAQRVFVDNRPEAYSKEFFEATYIPMQENEHIWRSMDEKFKFNCIYFYRHDVTARAQAFMVRRIRDPAWAPVFVDDFTLIFLKRNVLNSELIKKYEIPKNMFVVEQD